MSGKIHIVRLMQDDARIAEILSSIKKIEDSNLSVREYFDQNIVPFTRPQYYIHRKTLPFFQVNSKYL